MSGNNGARIFLLHPSRQVQEYVIGVCRVNGLHSVSYEDTDTFLSDVAAHHGCAVLDTVVPGGSGLAIAQKLRDDLIPVVPIFIAKDATVATAVMAMKAGAVDFITSIPGRE